MMVLDVFWDQTTENVKAQMCQEKCNLVIIPVGMTGMLQPLNVVIRQPFKAHMTFTANETMLMGCLKWAILTEMCWWILKGWRSILQDMITKSFKATYLLHGTTALTRTSRR
jgi:hypothetical protein